MKMSSAFSSLTLSVLGLAIAVPCSAAKDDEAAARAVAVADTIVLLLEPRAEEQIQLDMEAAQQMVIDAARDRAIAELRRSEGEARIKLAESEKGEARKLHFGNRLQSRQRHTNRCTDDR